MIIDAHSFPVAPLPTQVDFSDPLEIGIGTDAMHTSAALAEVVHTFFADRGGTQADQAVGRERGVGGSSSVRGISVSGRNV